MTTPSDHHRTVLSRPCNQQTTATTPSTAGGKKDTQRENASLAFIRRHGLNPTRQHHHRPISGPMDQTQKVCPPVVCKTRRQFPPPTRTTHCRCCLENAKDEWHHGNRRRFFHKNFHRLRRRRWRPFFCCLLSEQSSASRVLNRSLLNHSRLNFPFRWLGFIVKVWGWGCLPISVWFHHFIVHVYWIHLRKSEGHAANSGLWCEWSSGISHILLLDLNVKLPILPLIDSYSWKLRNSKIIRLFYSIFYTRSFMHFDDRCKINHPRAALMSQFQSPSCKLKKKLLTRKAVKFSIICHKNGH